MNDLAQPCVLCPPDRPRIPERPHACWPCRSWLTGMLGDLRILVEQIGAVEVPDGPLVAALIPGAPTGPRTRGVPESRPPLPLDPIDLAARARQGSRAPAARGALGDDDQIGSLPIATVLERWACDWLDLLRVQGKPEGRPEPTVAVLTRWLADRLDWACDDFEGIEFMAAELSGYRRTLRAVLGLADRPEYKTGVPCPTCDMLALYRRNGCEWIECGNCAALMSNDEYHRWVGEVAATPAQAA